jgi:glyoxylate reductase
MSKVFVCRKLPKVAFDVLQSCGVDIHLHDGAMPPSREELLRGIKGCEGILSLLSDRIDGEAMAAAGPQLKVVSNFAVGFNNVDVTEATRRGVRVGNTPGVLTDATADIAVGLLLAAARQFRVGMDAARNGGWRTWEPLGWIGQDLCGKTIGIVGMGRIGQAVARRLHGGWGMQVLYTSQNPKPEVDQKLAARSVEIDELLAQSDFVSIHLPLNDKTRASFGSAQFAQMKPSAVLINTARGEVVDQDALVDALSAGKIFAAGLDVCTPEPLPLDHPLHRLDNCLLLPHIGSATTLARNAMAQRSAENIVAGLAGKPLPYPVN